VAALHASDSALPVEPARLEEAARADTVVLAVPFAALDDTLEACTGALRDGALVLDVTVPLVFERGRARLVPVAAGSAAELVRARLPAGVRVAAALKSVPAGALARLDAPLDCDDFVCGDSPAARAAARALVARIEGLRPVDVGGLDAARAIEAMTLLALRINRLHRLTDARFRVVGLRAV